MDRRKFIGACAGVAATGVAISSTDRFCGPDIEFQPVVEGTWFTETYRGEKMQFERRYDSFGKDNLIYSVRSRFVNPKTGLKTVFAIGKMQTREMLEDGDDMRPYIENLRYAMKQTIDIIKAGRVLPNDARALFPAPIKPEGSPVMLI